MISSFYEKTNRVFTVHFDETLTRSMLKGFKCGGLFRKELLRMSIPYEINA